MIIDSRNEFADATSVASGFNVGTTLLGNVIDTGGDGINDVDGLYLVIGIDTDVAASGGAATVVFSLVSDSVATLDNSATTHFATSAIAKGTLVAGYTVARVELPKGTYERYLGVLLTVATNNLTGGKINAFLTRDPNTYKTFADAI